MPFTFKHIKKILIFAIDNCWCNTTTPPTINVSHTNDGTGTGSFTSNITGLQPGVTYYYRAYATNSYGTEYGETKTFMTTP